MLVSVICRDITALGKNLSQTGKMTGKKTDSILHSSCSCASVSVPAAGNTQQDLTELKRQITEFICSQAEFTRSVDIFICTVAMLVGFLLQMAC